MRIEQNDIAPEVYETITAKLCDRLKPFFNESGKQIIEDTVFDKKGLAAYLKVSESTINKLVMNRQIPFFKIQPGQSGGVRFYKRHIDKWIGRQSIPEIMPFNSNN